MNPRFRSLALSAFSLSLLLAASGCETSNCETEEGEDAVCAESLKKFTVAGAEQTIEVEYEAGRDLVIDNIKGTIHVNEGLDAGQISITFEPFTYRGHSKDAEAKDDIENKFSASFEWSEADEAYIARTDRSEGSTDELGAEITVNLPPEFDGVLRVVNQGGGELNPGDVNVNFTALSPTVNLENKSLVGNCDLDGAATVTLTTADCGGSIEIRNISDNVDVVSTGLETGMDILVQFASISDDATGGSIKSDDGQVDVIFPVPDEDNDVTANFSVDASTGEGAISVYDLRDDCESSGDDSAQSFVCGEGGNAVYTIRAGLDGVGEAPLKLDFDPTNN
jgi:hypothetical protein